MKLSISTMLFLWINARLGRWVVLDALMVFFARWLIYILVLSLAFTAWQNGWLFVLQLAVAIAIAIIGNWTISLFLHRPRPIVDHTSIKQLVHVYQTRKSFPSDHATMSFVAVLVSILSGVIWGWIAIVAYVAAVCVAIGRVYVGVHYPRDIIGGFVLAHAYAILSYPITTWLLAL